MKLFFVLLVAIGMALWIWRHNSDNEKAHARNLAAVQAAGAATVAPKASPNPGFGAKNPVHTSALDSSTGHGVEHGGDRATPLPGNSLDRKAYR